jgi:hypothetical protein
MHLLLRHVDGVQDLFQMFDHLGLVRHLFRYLAYLDDTEIRLLDVAHLNQDVKALRFRQLRPDQPGLAVQNLDAIVQGAHLTLVDVLKVGVRPDAMDDEQVGVELHHPLLMRMDCFRRVAGEALQKMDLLQVELEQLKAHQELLKFVAPQESGIVPVEALE